MLALFRYLSPVSHFEAYPSLDPDSIMPPLECKHAIACALCVRVFFPLPLSLPPACGRIPESQLVARCLSAVMCSRASVSCSQLLSRPPLPPSQRLQCHQRGGVGGYRYICMCILHIVPRLPLRGGKLKNRGQFDCQTSNLFRPAWDMPTFRPVYFFLFGRNTSVSHL